MRKLSTALFLLFLAATSGGATECGQVLDDPGFDAWCGDALCNWTLEAGAIARAPTWTEADAGVAMVGDLVSISQLSDVEAADGYCIAFDLIADVGETAEVRLKMDVNDDGSIDHDERIPTSDWRALSYRVRMPAQYKNVRFRLTKTGGPAVLANIGAEIAPDDECAGAALSLRPSCATVGTPGGSCE